jgi:hypothetical protein
MVLLLSVMVLLHGCSVYYKKPITLEKAAQEGKPVKVETNYQKTYKFERIEYKEGKFYGIQFYRRNLGIELLEEYITSIKLYNRTMSTILSVSIPAFLLGWVIIDCSTEEAGTTWVKFK